MRQLFRRVGWASQQTAVRTRHWLAGRQTRAGLSPDADLELQLDMLQRYYQQLRHLESDRAEPISFTVIVLDAGTGSSDMHGAIGSALIQTHHDWHLTGRAASGEGVSHVLRRFAELWPSRWHEVEAPAQLDPGPADVARLRLAPFLDQAIASRSGAGGPGTDRSGAGGSEYVLLLDSRDRLLPHALSEIARTVRSYEHLYGTPPAALYGDEVNLDARGQHPVHKPAWSPLLQLTTNYADGPVALRVDAVRDSGGFRGATRTEIVHELLLRSAGSELPVLVPHVLQVRASAGPRAGVATAAASLEQAGVHAEVSPGSHGTVAISFRCPEQAPLVSVIIPNRDASELISACVTSVLGSSYRRIEVVVVDNGSRDPQTRALYRDWAADPRVRLVESPGPFNFARLCNRGVEASGGEFVVLLNNDTEVTTGDWIEQMLGLARQPDVGVVGVQLRYPSGRVQHVGIAGLAERGTGHLFVGRFPDDDVPLNLLRAPHEVLAVTGACLMISRDLYREVGGLSETFLPNDGGDIDLCLRVAEAGRTTVVQPAAVLMHHESATRRRSVENSARFELLRKWPGKMLNDPYLNPNLEKSTKYLPDPDLPQPIVPVAVLEAWCRAGRIDGPSR